MKRFLKWLLIIVLIVLLLVLLLAGGVSWLAGTSSGFSYATGQADQRLEQIELTDIRGNLVSGVNGEAVSFANESMNLELTGIDTDWRVGCLLQREFCLDNASVDEVYIELLPREQTTAAAPSSDDITLPSIQLPIDFELKEVLIKKLRFQAIGDAPEQVIEDIRLSASTEGSVLTLNNASLAYQNYRTNLSGEVRLEDNYPLDLLLELEAADIIEEHDVSGTLKLSNNLDELMFAANINGAVAAQMSGTVSPLQKSLPLNAILAAEELGWPLDTHAQAKAIDLYVALNGTLDDYSLKLKTLLDGEQIPETALALEGLVNTERLELPAINIDSLGGGIDGSAALSWTQGINWLTDLDINNIDPSVHIADLPGLLGGKLVASGGVSDGNFTLDVSTAKVEGELSNFPFVLNAQLHGQ